MKNLKIGDLVREQRSDVIMCVHKVYALEVECQWFVGTTLHNESFHKSCLVHIEKTK